MTELVALLPLEQLQDRVGRRAALLRGQTEVAQAVVGILVLAKPCRRGAVAGGLWQRLVFVHGGELGLGRRRAAGQRVLSGWRAEDKEKKHVLMNSDLLLIDR